MLSCIHFFISIFQDKNGTPVICVVCEQGHDRLLEKLLDRGADPNARDTAKNNKPALVLATEGNHTECIKLLMVSGVDKNAVYDATGIGAVHRYTVNVYTCAVHAYNVHVCVTHKLLLK